MEWDCLEASGKGRIYSYAVHHRPALPGFDSPFIIVLVELEEGPRIVGNLLDARPDDIEIGRSVELVFHKPPGDDMVLPMWRLAQETPA